MRLNQALAMEKTAKARLNGEIDAAYKTLQKPNLFEGSTKTYVPLKDDADDVVPAVNNLVQARAGELLATVSTRMSELMDTIARKDWANCSARADLVVEGETLAKDVPATFLLFLGKQLTDLATVVGKCPTLDPAEAWKRDSQGLWRTDPIETARTKKVQKGIVLYPHNEKHPAQTQLITEDVTVGKYSLVKMSGALTEQQKKALLDRIDKMQRAVRIAREEANQTTASEVQIGAAVLGWINKE